MIAIVMLLAFPLGFFCKNRTAAYVVYVAVFAHVYAFQTANLVMEWVNGSGSAFPQDTSEQLLGGTTGYLVFTSMIYAVGFGLVWLGHWLRVRRTKKAGSVQLDPARA